MPPLDKLRLPRIPQEPLARFRLLSVCFAAAIAFLNAGLFAFDASLTSAVRWEEVAAAMLLGTWWLYGYTRGGIPAVGLLVDMGLVLVVAALSPMPANGIALFFAGIQFRALITPRRQLPWLIASYGVARIVSTMLWHAHGSLTYGPLSASSVVSVLGLTIIGVSLSLFSEATERHDAAARELARSDERYRLVARATRDVVYDWHVASGRIEWTESIHSVFGYAPEQAGDVAWWLDRVHPADIDALQGSVQAVTADPAAAMGTVHYRVRRADGRYAHVSGSMIVQRGPDGTAERVIGSIRDVTTEHILEERLRRAQKMEAVGQLAGGIAHDFNNLLTVIGGHVYMAGVNRGETAKERELLAAKHLAGITQAADRAAALTKQLLAFGRKQLLTPTLVDVNGVVEDVLQMMRPSIGEQVKLVARLEPALWPVYADAGQLGQVLVNLMLNARDAMRPAGGTLTIDTANTTLEDTADSRSPDAMAAGPLSGGEYVRLRVRDTGMGMDATTLARAFEPFFTTKAHGHGTGLGLATVYGIVKQSFGDIHVESAPGSGSTFIIHLPVAPAERRQVRMTAEPKSDSSHAWTAVAPMLGHGGVLLVEDDDGVRQFAADILAHAGYRVRTARHGVDALEQMRKYEGSIDVVVTDVVMPEMGGRELVERLRQRRPDLPVLYITGYTDDARMLDELKAADARLLEKPFTAAALAEAVAGLGPLIPMVARAS